MGKPTAFEKRVKRNITAREHLFFVPTTPGLKRLCLNELNKILPPEKINKVEGGIEFTGYVQDCYNANLHLHTANRILMRIDEFTAKNFRTLEKKLGAIPFELYLNEESLPEIKVSTKTSRLYHKDAIAERFYKVLYEKFNYSLEADEKEQTQKLFVRAVDDHFVISIDSSGKNLHKRGIKKHGGKAPIRETLAAAILQMAGYDPEKPLIDPMCGTGTFSFEAALMASNIPPGWFRDFAFFEWPCFRPQRLIHIKKEAKENFSLPKKPLILSSDIDIKAKEKYRTPLLCSLTKN